MSKEEQKARELVEKFMEYPNLMDYTEDLRAKQCALIAVDEILKVANLMDGGFSFEEEIAYWNKVKEIIKSI